MIKNSPDLWQQAIPHPAGNMHKYDRGYLVILGGQSMPGAARLAAEAAMRAGIGICTIVAPSAAAAIYQSGPPHILYEPLRRPDDFSSHLNDPRRNGVLIGPGADHNETQDLQNLVLSVLQAQRPTVLDASALTVFAHCPEKLINALHHRCVLTPHEGEFAKLFGPLQDNRVAALLNAMNSSAATILLKGAETLIATPGQQDTIVNTHASPYLATAGSGDVLAGIIASLMTQGMSPQMAAAAGAWIHGEASLQLGPGLIAPDLINQIPGIIHKLITPVTIPV